ncbi:MAG: ABC transporter substrate-binding protein [Romboutsia sp.]|uniref:ABC transporter substrate-binding protein n=1 Tax=Romboutsia sp. TaxID=1965302 RepID=UPI003F2B1CBE
MKKYISIMLSIALCSIGLVGCSSAKEVKSVEDIEVKIVAPDGLPSISIAKLAKEKTLIKDGYKLTYNVEATSETLSTTVMKQEPDIAIVPSNMAAIAYNKTSNYQIAGTVGMGSFYLVSSENLGNISDIVGKEVGNTGKGLTPDITVQSLLKEKGINPEEINFNYVNSASELVPLLATGKIKTGFIPEPALTGLLAKNSEMKIIASLNEEWKVANSSKNGYPQSTIIVKSDFAKENEEFVKMFLSELSASIDWANKNSEDAGVYANEIGVSTDAKVIGKSMERANLRFVLINDMIEEYNDYYKKLFDFDSKTVGGSIPDEKIYFVQK